MRQVTRETYKKTQLTAYKEGECKCGKYRRRQKTFWGMSNPFNNWKSPQDLRKSLQKDIKVWKKEPITCKDCE